MTRKLNVWIPAVVLLLPLAGLGIWRATLQTDGKHNGLSEIFEGYRELTPPSRLFGPGTIGTVEKLSDGSLQLHLACTMDQNELAPLWLRSTTVNKRFASKVENSYNASTEALRNAVAKAAGKRVKQVSASLKDMHVITMSHENLLNIRAKYLTGRCEEAIVWNLRAGADVCQTEEVLQADIAYRVSFEDGQSTNGKIELTEEIAGSVDVTLNSTNADEVRGEDLYFGVRVNVSCFRLDNDGHLGGIILG